MAVFLLIFLSFLTDASETRFSLTLTDKDGHDRAVSMNGFTLNHFQLLYNLSTIHLFSDKRATTISHENMSYEVFANIILPLANELKWFSTFTFDDQRAFFSPEEIINGDHSLTLLINTKKVIQWVYKEEKNNTIENFPNHIVAAYRAADFLQLPFAIKRGFVNYLYDKGLADQVVDASDLTANSSEWLISNSNFYPGLKKKKYEIDNFTLDFSCADIRFFDFDSLSIPIKKNEMKFVLFLRDLHFDFQNNKIQEIDLGSLRSKVTSSFGDCAVVFDFRNNPLSNITKSNIESLGKQESLENFSEYIELNDKIHILKHEIGHKQQVLRNLKSSRLKFYWGTFFASSILILGLAYVSSSKILLQLFRNKYFINCLGFSLLLSAGPIFYLYKNIRNEFLDDRINLRSQDIDQDEKSLKNLEGELFKRLVIDNFEILYTK